MQQNKLWTSVAVSPQVNLCMYGPGIKRNHQQTAVLKTVLTIFLRNNSEMGNLLTSFHLAVSFWA